MVRFDIIGDVHGYADILEQLLAFLGYAQTPGGRRHPQRIALFVGDLIDRGTQNFRTLRLVKQMADSGAAFMVMGNHEYNALCFHTPHPNGGFLRPHSPKNIKQHKEVLEEIDAEGETGQTSWRMYMEWFRTLPLFLELEGIRIVHACWDQHLVDLIKRENESIRDANGRLTDSFLLQSAQEGHPFFEAIESLLKGVEIPLPPDHPGIHDKEMNLRKHVRLKWWLDPHRLKTLKTYDQAARVNGNIMHGIKGLPIPPDILTPLQQRFKDHGSTPTFIGHYWFSGKPSLLTETIASVDYSLAKGGPLLCYRWDGETTLDPAKFVSIFP
jgi:hypothetical protein